MLAVRLHAASPFPPLIYGAGVFIALTGAYRLIASLVGQPILETSPSGAVQINSGCWAALVLSLIVLASITIAGLFGFRAV